MSRTAAEITKVGCSSGGIRSAQLAMAMALALVAAGATGTALPARAAAPDPNTCTGALPGNFPPTDPGTLRYGINPRVQAGQIGPVPAPALPEDAGQHLASLAVLSQGRPFVLRLNRVFWPEPPGQLTQLDADVQRYSAAGYLLELQLRYHPEGSTPDPAAFAAWAAGITQRYDTAYPLVSVQVTNEVNFAVSKDSSDGAYAGATDALISGVERVKAQALADGASQLRVGFNWFYRTDGPNEKAFWGYLAAHGGVGFTSALDWVGLDAYPGTYFPPAEPAPNGYYGGMVNAMSVLHDCFMPYGGVASKAIYIEETGYPTDLTARTPQNQDEALQELTAAAHDYGHRYNVTDFRWFNLRDADSSSPNFQQHFGLLNSDYSRKPAFCTYRRVVTGLADCPAIPSTSAGTAAKSPPVPLSQDRADLPPTSGVPSPRPLWLLVALTTLAGLALSTRRGARPGAG